MPHNITVETLGKLATPLLEKGARLPTEITQIFSTAADNQQQVEAVTIPPKTRVGYVIRLAGCGALLANNA